MDLTSIRYYLTWQEWEETRDRCHISAIPGCSDNWSREDSCVSQRWIVSKGDRYSTKIWQKGICMAPSSTWTHWRTFCCSLHIAVTDECNTFLISLDWAWGRNDEPGECQGYCHTNQLGSDTGTEQTWVRSSCTGGRWVTGYRETTCFDTQPMIWTNTFNTSK